MRRRFRVPGGFLGSGSLIYTRAEKDWNRNAGSFRSLRTRPEEELILRVLWKLRSERNIRSSGLITS